MRAELAALKRLCYAGLGAGALRGRVAERLERALALDAFCFPAADPLTALPVDVLHQGRPPEAFDEFLDRVYLRSIVSDIGRCARLPRRVVLVEELLALSAFERDPYPEVMLRPYRLRHEVHLSLAQRGTAWGHLCLARRARAFRRDELALLACLVPHLRAGLRAARLRAALAAGTDGDVGVVLTDRDGRVEFANGAAERLLSRPRAAGSPSVLAGLQWVGRLLARTLDGGEEDTVTVPFLTLADGGRRRAYRISAERVRGRDGEPRVLILLEPVRPSETPATMLALGLTPREADVACAVVRGATAAETARRLGISPHTVLHHLRAVYDKLGVRSRAALALRLAGGGVGGDPHQMSPTVKPSGKGSSSATT